MKITTMIMTAVAVVGMATIAVTGAPIAKSAYPMTGQLGSELAMTDSVGQVQLTWTVSDLKSSADTVPGYPVAGQLWEATATVKSALAVVVAALTTTGNGQPAVDIVDSDGTQQLHLVSLGIFDDANGLVQIYGSGLGAGQHVAVPGHGKTS